MIRECDVSMSSEALQNEGVRLSPPAPTEKVASEPIEQALKFGRSDENVWQMRRSIAYTDEADHGKPECRVKNDREVKTLFTSQALVILYVTLTRQAVDIFDRNRKTRIREHPHRHQARSERLVLVVHRWLFNLFFDHNLGDSAGDSLLESGIDVFLRLGHIFNNGGVAFAF